MPLSRRSFVTALGVGSAASAFPARAFPASGFPWITARGMESRESTHHAPGAAPMIRLDSNENPYGPAPAAMEALQRAFGEAHRYPDSTEDALRAAIAAHHGVKPESVILGCGSTELLMMVTEAFASPTRGVVTAAPSFETPNDTAARMKVPLVAVPIDKSLRLDLDQMGAKAMGAGLVYLCNPNNPTGTLHGADAVAQFAAMVTAKSPETYVVVDEAYFEFADDPAYRTAIPLALANPRVVVTRTFSKIHGMAGLRAGYAIAAPETIRLLEPYRVPSGINALVGAAAITSLSLDDHVKRQIALNHDTRAWTMKAIEGLGYATVPSQTNFFLTDIRRDPKWFKKACRERGLSVGRYFPGLETFARISVGTMAEMQQAMPIIADLLKGRV